jgi:chromosome segregation ATPase
MANELRVTAWGPLLRSQQQHVVLSAALHLKCDRQASQPAGMQNMQETQELHKQCQTQAEAIEDLRSQLDNTLGQLQQAHVQLQHAQPAPPQPAGSLFLTQPTLSQDPDNAPTARPRPEVLPAPAGQLSITQARTPQAGNDAQAQRRVAELESRLAEAQKNEQRLMAECEEARRESENQRAEAESLRSELENISTEANRKIEAANDRIRTLRQRKDEAEQELQQVKSNIPMHSDEKAALESENRQLMEQKEALLRIVEDLHQTCLAAGLNTGARQSIDNMTCTITQELRLT